LVRDQSAVGLLLRRIQQIAPVETLQPQYSLIEREVERELGRGVGSRRARVDRRTSFV
jgi:hypothetical protein